jgi:membrane peptidoglycan carboxypeptidase
MGRTTGGTLPAQIWADTMRVAHEGVENHPLPGYDQPVRSAEEVETASFFDTLAREFGESSIVEDLQEIFN